MFHLIYFMKHEFNVNFNLVSKFNVNILEYHAIRMIKRQVACRCTETELKNSVSTYSN